MAKQTKILTKRKKFIEAEIPLTNSKIELIGNSPEDLKDRTIKLDLTRQLKGKSVEAVVKIKIENDKAIAYPTKIKLMPYFIIRMIRKRISYVEDSFETPSQESILRIKPFLITRKRVSRAVRKTLRNKTKNWIEDYIAEKKDNEIFNEILSNKLQRPLSLMLKKTYPLSLCEIRVLEVVRPLKPEEIPKIKKPKEQSKEKGVTEGAESLAKEKAPEKLPETTISKEDTSKKPLGVVDKDIKKAEKEIKETQKKAIKIESKEEEKKRVTEEAKPLAKTKKEDKEK